MESNRRPGGDQGAIRGRFLAQPAAAQLFVIELEPLHGDEGYGVGDLALLQPVQRLNHGHGEDADVFMFLGDAVNAAVPAAIKEPSGAGS